jgi:ankyrin repeat protein
MHGVRRLIALVWLSSPIWLTGCSQSAGSSTNTAADRMNAFELMIATKAANSIEEAGLLFYEGLMRFQIDMQAYPPVESGANGPEALQASLSFSIGQFVGPKLASDPVAKAKIAKRLANWNPSFDAAYDPGWKYHNPLDQKAALEIAAQIRKKVVGPLEAQAKLAENPDYVRLSKDLAAADGWLERVQEKMQEEGKSQPIPDQTMAVFEDARGQKIATARKMKDIEWQQIPDSRWHAIVGWKAEDYFHDPQVISLCKAIEANDIAEMERLIAAGADVNVIGKDGMTPLLWAFPDQKPERFEYLLRHGANPNVFFQSDFGVGTRPFHPIPGGFSYVVDQGCCAGQSVTHLSAQAPDIDFLRLVLDHGGDANLVDKKTGETPLDLVTDFSWPYRPDMKDRVALLIAHHANLNHYSHNWHTYPDMAAVMAHQYDVALMMLQAGADPKLYQPDGERKFIHVVLDQNRFLKDYKVYAPQKLAEYQALVDWLEQHGESLAAAQADEDHWADMYKNAFSPEATAKVRKEIIAERNSKHGGKQTHEEQ